MIAWLSGKVVDASILNCIVLDVQGVGYAVEITTPTYSILASERNLVNLFIYTHVREDAIVLFGFLEQEERALFKALIKVNGIGPKSAIAILSAMSPSMFIQAVQLQDKSMLTKLPGVGAKTAARILIEMKDILQNPLLQNFSNSTSLNHGSSIQEAASALEALGYKYQLALETVKKLEAEEQDTQSLIKQALKQLSKY
jgi:Holliday junction DNA helicase RuvA